jgi:succinate dehydrogenase flavin-adding protein (antitoxin of CptAB toxin-antitoxin module)
VVFASLQEGLLAERKLSMEALVEKDRAFAALFAEKDRAFAALFAEKDRAFAALFAEKDWAFAEKDRASAEKDRAFASLLAEKDGKFASLLAEKDGKFASLHVKLLEEKDKTSASLLAAKDLKSEIKDLDASLVQLQHRMDVALGVVSSRAVLEATIDAVWYMLYPPGGAIQKPKVTSMSGRLKHLLGGEPPSDTTPGCLGLLSYLRAMKIN